MNSCKTAQIGPYTFTIGQRVQMLVNGKGSDGDDNEACYAAGDMATIVQIERYSGSQDLGIGVELENGIFNMFDAADDPPRYPFVPLPGGDNHR
jgi:hypothetical protein